MEIARLLILCVATLASAFPFNALPRPAEQAPEVTCAIQDTKQGLSIEAWFFLSRFYGVLLGFETDLGNSTTTADLILDVDFVVLSDSQASMQGRTLASSGYGTITFTKEDYLNATRLRKDYEGVEIYTLDLVVSCDTLVWQWMITGYGNGVLPLRGFHWFHFIWDADSGVGLKATQARIEFNSIAGLLNAGGAAVFPGAEPIDSYKNNTPYLY